MNLPANYIDEIKRILDTISQNLPGYRPRHSQKRMIAAIAEVLSRAPAVPAQEENDESTALPNNTGGSILCVEGPTGVGKSLGYLIGGTVAARAQNRKLVISSATVALQEQLVNRDLPFFVKYSGLALTCTIAKGRGRYVCHAKLLMASGRGENENLFDDEPLASAVTTDDGKTIASLLAAYENKQWSGDRDELTIPINDALWSLVTTDRHSCMNKKCPNFTSCAQMAARDRIHSADIIVTNHDLLLADMALGGGIILPDPAKTFYVLDEGHHIAKKAVETFANSHHVDACRLMMGKLSICANRIGQTYHELSTEALSIGNDAEYLSEALEDAYLMFDNIDKAVFVGNVWRFPENKLFEDVHPLATNIVKTSDAILTSAGKALEYMRKQDSVIAQKLLTDLGFFFNKVESVHKTWRLLMDDPVVDGVPVAKWVELQPTKKNKVDFVVHACPAFASKMLVDMFFKKVAGAVITSATLKTLGNFNQLLSATGLDMLPETSVLSLPSPFNHADQGVLSIPDIKASATQQAEHTSAIAGYLPLLLAKTGQRGTLVLFASRKQMNDVAALLPTAERNLVLIQGERAKENLLETHHRRIKNKQASVLFGLQSFAEGLDLPGDACWHVVIAKIPFAVPSDPVEETLSEWLALQNRSYFEEVAMPQACLRMIQAAGRLIRTEEDSGILTILDDRMKKKRYGKLILNSLPPFRMAA